MNYLCKQLCHLELSLSVRCQLSNLKFPGLVRMHPKWSAFVSKTQERTLLNLLNDFLDLLAISFLISQVQVTTTSRSLKRLTYLKDKNSTSNDNTSKLLWCRDLQCLHFRIKKLPLTLTLDLQTKQWVLPDMTPNSIL